MSVLGLQIFAGVVITLVKEIKGYIVIGGMIVVNTALVILSLTVACLGGEAFMNSNGFSLLLVGNLFVWSVVAGGYAFAHIEEVYR